MYSYALVPGVHVCLVCPQQEERALCEQITENRRVQDLQLELERTELRPVTVHEWAVAAGHPSAHQLMAALQEGRRAERTMLLCHQGLVRSVAFRCVARVVGGLLRLASPTESTRGSIPVRTRTSYHMDSTTAMTVVGGEALTHQHQWYKRAEASGRLVSDRWVRPHRDRWLYGRCTSDRRVLQAHIYLRLLRFPAPNSRRTSTSSSYEYYS